MQKRRNFKHVAIVSVKESDYKIHFWHISKDDAINVMKNFPLKKWINIMYFITYKMSETTYYYRNRKTILNRPKHYYENSKELLREKARKNYRELSEKEKYIKREYGRNRYKNMSEENIKRLQEYQKNKHNFFFL